MNHLNCPYCAKKAVETFDMHDGTKMYRCRLCGIAAASPKELFERARVGKVSWGEARQTVRGVSVRGAA